ncbi:hypothetical protein [Parapusillimonas granuli]|uniref:Uncharacterized protein n=1 Tax=Parapusillimonas granuli TaxID=380911 RepID=A0A853G4Y3_9BURK|nr:hypothetical protein [Parapusillimonas granuli]MBB5217642.1 hypothetical protein [Parapusillimonas granuli]NYT51943.1 hypothetical protein [Parapusillimonas granuli]
MIDDPDELTRWIPVLTRNQDVLSQRLVAHALAERWGLRGLAWTLNVFDDELRDIWADGQGLAGAPASTTAAAASVLGIGIWQARFLAEELSLSSFVTDESRSDLISQARARWPELNEAPGEVALLALVLSGHTFTPRGFWRRLLDGPEGTTRV